MLWGNTFLSNGTGIPCFEFTLWLTQWLAWPHVLLTYFLHSGKFDPFSPHITFVILYKENNGKTNNYVTKKVYSKVPNKRSPPISVPPGISLVTISVPPP